MKEQKHFLIKIQQSNTPSNASREIWGSAVVRAGCPVEAMILARNRMPKRGFLLVECEECGPLRFYEAEDFMGTAPAGYPPIHPEAVYRKWGTPTFLKRKFQREKKKEESMIASLKK